MSRNRRHDPPDPVAEYREWTEHRYTPGYYLGAKFPPGIRNALGAAPGGYAFGVVMIGLGCGGVWLAWRGPHPSPYAYVLAAFISLCGAGAIAIGVSWLRRVRVARRSRAVTQG